MFTHFFIDRPILSSVISILFVLAGLVAMSVAPIEQYPELAPPSVNIGASYPGATAEVIANQVASPIEAQLNGIDNLLYFSSTSSSSGNVAINVVFKPGSDPDINQVNVQNRVSQALSLLPQTVTQQGVGVEKQSSSIMMVLSIYSPDDRYSSTYIDNYTNLYVLDELKRVPGANRASVFGLPDIAMRVWLQPDRMAQLGITVQEVSFALQSQNQTFGIGQIGGQPSVPGTQQTFVITAQGLLTKPEQFEDVIVRAGKEGAATVRLRDIGRVELDKRDYSIVSRMNGKRSTTLAIYQQPGANAVATATAVRKRLSELKQQFPTGLDYRIALDTSLFTLNSIEKVVHTFFEAVVLVVIVVFVFLQSLRATIIPILAVPVSIIGTFVGMHLLGFSVNMLTLFGMILAIGLVVDDAIVVVESVEANMAAKDLSPLEAAKVTMTQIAGALISIVLVLVAVFLPVAFLGGVTGKLYQQFAVTIAISMVISGIMALTLSPALAAIILRAHHGEKKNRFFRGFDRGFERLRTGYVGLVARTIQGWPVALLVFAGFILGIVFMFRTIPSSFVPDEDQGYFFAAIIAPDTANLDVVAKFTERVQQIVSADPAVQDVASVAGYSLVDGQIANNGAVIFASMKPFEERKDASLLSFAVLPRLNAQFANLKDGFVFALNPPSISGMGTTGGFEFYLQNRGAGDARATGAAVQTFLAKARQRPELAGVSTTYTAATQQLFVDLDRSKAEALGVTVSEAFATMQAFFGSQIAGQFSAFSRVWWVILQADASYRMQPSDFDKVFVRSKSGANVPLSALMTTSYVAQPKLVTRFNGFPAVKITGSQAPGYSSGQAIAAMEAVARELPGDFSFAWSGQALQEKESGSTSSSAFVFGLILVFLLLAAQFEKWTLPIAVVLTIPISVLGALVLTWLVGLENDVYFQVGLVTLVGLSAKNAILICEVAIEHVREGMSARDAALAAAGARLRAIVMTSLAFGFGCVPLAIASGAGANSLRAIGTGVIGGILASMIVAVVFAPMFFFLLESMSQRFAAKRPAVQPAPQEGD